MIDGLCVHGANDGEFVSHGRQLRKKIRIDPGPTLAATLKIKLGCNTEKLTLPTRHGSKPLALAHALRKWLAIDLLKGRLVIEEVDMARPAGEEEVDDPLGLGREMGKAGGRGRKGRRRGICRKQLGEGRSSHQG